MRSRREGPALRLVPPPGETLPEPVDLDAALASVPGLVHPPQLVVTPLPQGEPDGDLPQAAPGELRSGLRRRPTTAVDLFAAGVAAGGALLLNGLQTDPVHAGVAVSVPLLWIGLLALRGGYDPRPRTAREMRVALSGAAARLLACIAIASFLGVLHLDRAFVLTAVGGTLLASAGLRRALRSTLATVERPRCTPRSAQGLELHANCRHA